jgi:citrate lyase beta subunit
MTFDALALGATLYVPATRDDLLGIVTGSRIDHLRSVVVCLEDSVLQEDVEMGMAKLARMLGMLHGVSHSHENQRPLLLVRPRTPDVLARISAMPGSNAIDGYVLPKATAANMPDWIAPISNRSQAVLPTIETREAFEPDEMRLLRAQLLTMQERVPCIRIGGNDLLQLVGARRSTSRTAYDGPLGSIIASLVSTFAPWGFSLSAPVLESFQDHDLLREEIERDIEHGLMTKTAIHPSQIPVIHAAYAVSVDDLESARHILDADAAAVYKENGVMAEPATHRRWAADIVRRAEAYGTRRLAAAA